MADDAMKLAGVMGWPIHHSRSPRLHGYWLRRYDIDGAYLPLAVVPDRVEAAVTGLAALGFAGCNVTLPHKQAVMPLMDELDETARRIGAVNTIIVDVNRRLIGRNTDAYGFIQNLRAGVDDIDLTGATACLLGAGGAARAIVYALLEAGVTELRLTNRTAEKAQALAAEFGKTINVVSWAERSEALSGCALLVNSTNLGMTGQPPLEIALDALPADAVVNDIVYAPLETPLLTSAKARGHTIVDGLGMLLHQAQPAFEAWFGHRPEVDAGLREYVLNGDGT